MKIKLINLVGARPQFVKAAAISRAINTKYSNNIKEILVHSGQHYDAELSDVFFEELQITKPHYLLKIGSESHAKQTAQMMIAFEEVLLKESPDVVLLYGDTNTTLAGALTAAKLNVPIAHIEAGLRSFDRTMPEEVNRIITDKLSKFLFSPTQSGINNLKNEGVTEGVFFCGDVMLDSALYYSNDSKEIINEWQLKPNEYILATIHRASNTDQSNRLKFLLKNLIKLAEKHQKKLVIPLHPRTRKAIAGMPEIEELLKNNTFVSVLPSVSYTKMLSLEKESWLIATDSGGVQKEAYFFNKPCLILRNTTEWIEMVDNGCASLIGENQKDFDAAVCMITTHFRGDFKPLFGDGLAAQFILSTLIDANP